MRTITLFSIGVALFLAPLLLSGMEDGRLNFTQIRVTISTGADDARCEAPNGAFISFNFRNGSTSREYRLGCFSSNSTRTVEIQLENPIEHAAAIASVIIRHNGTPRNMHGFDTYDNWDLTRLQVELVVDGGDRQTVVNYSGQPLCRFTGQLRNRTWNFNGSVPNQGPPSTINVFITTGSDDLRCGNQAFIRVNYQDGTSSPELSLGGCFSQNSNVSKPLTLDRVLRNYRDIQSVLVRHNGAARPGNPLDTYDNWDLQGFRIEFNGRNVLQYNGNPLHRFTGNSRSKTFVRNF